MVPSPSLSNKANASLNSVICSSVSSAAMMFLLLLFFCVVCVLYACATKRVKSWFKIRSFQTGNSPLTKGDGGREKNKKAFWCIKKYQQSQESFHPSLSLILRERICFLISITTVCKLCLSLSLSHSRACFFRRTSIPALFILRHSPRASSSSSSSRQIKVFSFSFWLRRERGGEAFSVSIAFA